MEPSDEDAARQARARARAHWPGRKVTLAETGRETPLEAPAALATMWQLCLEAWLLTGKAIPEYDRGAAPGRLWRDGAVPPEHVR